MHMRRFLCRSLLTAVLTGLMVRAGAQEVVINVSLSQPRLLEVDAGPDVRVYEEGEVTLGDGMDVTGGTPEFTYLWEDGSGNSWTGELITVSGYGDYELTVTDANHCTAKDVVSVINAVSAYPGRPDRSVIYPNPTAGNVSIPLKGLSGSVELEILSVTGSVVHQEHLSVAGDADVWILELGRYSPGIYQVRLAGSNQTVIHSVVIQ